ncbi:MAG: bifunctional riboflavin kinase/FAD synthetase [Acidimicrobiales bacterium]|nr:bifunctional riboflavin kinase/FAD synthetase [Acidimicrobiales bacterium]
MEVIRDIDWCPKPEKGCVVTIGQYDGVHRGHRAVVSEMHRIAAELNARTAVVTFDVHPATVVRPESAPLQLSDLEQKLELLAETGVDYVLVITFDQRQASMEAADFVDQVLIECLNAKAVVVGEDFHFGKGRGGNVSTLTKMGADLGFEVMGLPLVKQATSEGETISSTAIRAALSAGDVAKAQRLLGRPYEVRGTVSPGDRRGRTIGFPTANVPTDARTQLPAEGVYAAIYERPDGSKHKAAVNIGRRPTFYEFVDRPLIEAHLIGFRGDLYDEEAKVRFVQRLRGEKRFDGIDELKAQLELDIAAASEALR